MAATLNGGTFDDEFVECVQLAVSEVVTNAVRHGGADDGQAIELVLTFDSNNVRVDVCDNGTGFAPKRPMTRLQAPGGMGLGVVEALSERWGVARGEQTRVWFELDASASRVY